MKEIKLFDYLVIVLLLILPFSFVGINGKYQKKLKIMIGEDVYYEKISDIKHKIINLEYKYRKNMKIEIANGKARISDSDCRDKLCVRHSWIEECLESSICIPNRVAIQIECTHENYDTLSY